MIHPGPPHTLVLELARRCDVRHFIECGTFLGNTALWAAGHFPRVTTVERSHTLYEQARDSHRNVRNLEFRLGDSRTVLGELVPTLTAPAMFWLDSHWSGGVTSGENDECPLLDEIRIINASPHTHFVLIDDARLFLSPPPEPHRIEQWPAIDTVMFELCARRDRYYTVVFEDVIVAVPPAARTLVAEHCQRASTHAFHEQARAALPAPADGLWRINEKMKRAGGNLLKRVRRQA